MRENKSFIPQDYNVFAGLDVDKKSIVVTCFFTNETESYK